MRKSEVKNLCRRVKAASRELALVSSDKKASALRAMSRALIANAGRIITANDKDAAAARKKGLSSSLIDRLMLNKPRIASMAKSMEAIAGMNDPVGAVLEKTARPNGLLIEKVRVPIGVILIIYESRPNVTSDCAALCLKSSNAVILRGGSEAKESNIAIYEILRREVVRHGLPEDSIFIIKDTDKAIINELLKQEGLIDLVMPRGGESLIRAVAKNSRIPVIKHYKGVCHVYVDDTADVKMAQDICFNAKVQRPGVCNAMETMLVNRRIGDRFLPAMIRRFQNSGVQIRGSREVARFGENIKIAAEADWYTEYLDLKLSAKIVKGVDEAIAHIMKYGSYHSDAIITRSKANADRFLKEVDSACVYVNASTRFTDGGEFGKGAEIGISTDKIHARGPMGLEELMSYKYVIHGNGQVRK